MDLSGAGSLLLQITLYPVLAVCFAYLIFNITGKASVFFLAPVFYWGLSYVAPIDPTFTPEDSPALLSWAGAWFYGTHLAAIGIVFYWFRKNARAWLFFLAPMVGWVIQIASLVVAVAVH